MSAPAALVIAKVLYPEDGEPTTRGSVDFQVEKIDINGIDALTRGTLEGLKLFWNIAAMLLVFVAVVAMFNALIGAIGGLFGLDISLELILGYIFAPFAYLMGIPAAEAEVVGMLLGKKLVLTELIAFGDLAQMQQSTTTALSERSAVITSYALCGFANFASIGIQIGGIGGIAPERRGDLAKLGFKAMIGGTIAAMMTGAVAGLLY
jgi:CNT family concentrative nucleoside transporter